MQARVSVFKPEKVCSRLTPKRAWIKMPNDDDTQSLNIGGIINNVAKEILEEKNGTGDDHEGPSREHLCQKFHEDKLSLAEFQRLMRKFGRLGIWKVRRGPTDESTCDTCLQLLGLCVEIGSDHIERHQPSSHCERGQKCRCYWDMLRMEEHEHGPRVVYQAWQTEEGVIYLPTDEKQQLLEKRGLEPTTWHAREDTV
jgi:hypothetical protein